MTIHRIIVGRNQTGASGKTYSAGGSAKSALAPTAVLAVQRAFQTVEELGAILRDVANDPTAIVILNPAIGIQDNIEFHILSSKEMQSITNRDEQYLRANPVHKHPDGRPAIARLKESFAPGTIMLLDRDVTEFTPVAFGEAFTVENWQATLDALLPGLSTAGSVSLPSNSSRVLSLDGKPRSAKNGHRYVLCNRPIPANMGTVIETQAMRAQLAWAQESKSGAKLLRTIVDTSVFVPGRWVFAGSPTSDGTVTIAKAEPMVTPGIELDISTIPDTKGYEQLCRGLGIESKLRDNGNGGCDVYDLRLDDVIETQHYGEMTIRDIGALIQSGAAPDGKVRCQVTNWRPESTSWNGVIRIGDTDGRIFVFDQGTRTSHWLDTDGMRTILGDPYWSAEAYRLNPVMDQIHIGPVPGSSPVPVTRVDTTPGAVVPAYGAPMAQIPMQVPGSLYPIPLPRKRTPVPWQDVAPAPRYVIPKLFPEKITIIAGSRGHGKTAMLMLAIAHVTHLVKMPAFDHGPYRKAVIFSEDPEQTMLLLQATTGKPSSEIAKHIVVYQAQALAPVDLIADLKEISAEHTVGDARDPTIMRKPWMAVDTLSSNFRLEDFSALGEVSAAMADLAASELNVVLMAHFSKGSKEGSLEDGTAAGSQTWESLSNLSAVFGAPDGAKISESDDRALIITKNRVPVAARNIPFKGESREIATRNEYGEPGTTHVHVAVCALEGSAGQYQPKAGDGTRVGRGLEAIEAEMVTKDDNWNGLVKYLKAPGKAKDRARLRDVVGALHGMHGGLSDEVSKSARIEHLMDPCGMSRADAETALAQLETLRMADCNGKPMVEPYTGPATNAHRWFDQAVTFVKSGHKS